YTDDYPDVVKAKSDIAALKKKIAETQNQKGAAPEKSARTAGEPLQIQQLRAQVHQYDQMIKDKTVQEQQIQNQIRLYQARVQSSPAVEQEYKELTRDYQTALDFYNDLLKKRDQSAMASDLQRRQEGEQFRVLDPANLPDKPSFPNKLLFTLGGLAGGLAIGIGIVFLIEMQDTSLRSERDVETMLRLPVLAMVPEIQPLGSSHRPIPANSSSLRAQIEMGTKV
ncbi:MAG: GNVR domain-containing protein, partial [Blastocatellia bacterium]